MSGDVFGINHSNAYFWLSFGLLGGKYIDDTTKHEFKEKDNKLGGYMVHFLEDSVIDSMVLQGVENISALSALSKSENSIIWGRLREITLTSGSCIVYEIPDKLGRLTTK